MSRRPYIYRLHGRHALLDAALAEELGRPEPDGSIIAAIQRRKQEVRDRLRALELKAATEGLHA